MTVKSGEQDYARLMRFGVLGPLEVRADGEQLAIKGVKERRLLGLLLSRANSVVPVDNIFEALWGTEPPPSAAKLVQVYASGCAKCWSRAVLCGSAPSQDKGGT